jgi:hypothetical protein
VLALGKMRVDKHNTETIISIEFTPRMKKSKMKNVKIMCLSLTLFLTLCSFTENDRASSEADVHNTVLIYDETSLALTLCVRPNNSDKALINYLI